MNVTLRGFGGLSVLLALGVCCAAEEAPLRIRLTPFAIPPDRHTGLLVRARVDDGPWLRLLLDSGARHLVLSKRAAARSGYHGGEDLDLVGMGRPAAAAKLTRVRTMAVGELVLRDVPMVIAPGAVADGLDGVVPLSAFRGYLVRLHAPERVLELLPYPDSGVVADGSGEVYAQPDRGMLFLRVVLNGEQDALLLLDTGASYSAISQRVAGKLRTAVNDSRHPVPLQAGSGAIAGTLLAGPVSARFGMQKLELNPVLALDFSDWSRYQGMEVAGIVGYPALRDSVLTVNYRDARVEIARAPKH